MRLQGHIAQRWLQTATLLIMIVASMGYTSIVGYCSMSNSSECCCSTPDACELHPLIPGQTSVRTDTNCFTSQTYGGLSETPAIEISTTAFTASTCFPSDPASPAIDIELVLKSVYSPNNSPDHAPPPTGDICIQVRTLLI